MGIFYDQENAARRSGRVTLIVDPGTTTSKAKVSCHLNRSRLPGQYLSFLTVPLHCCPVPVCMIWSWWLVVRALNSTSHSIDVQRERQKSDYVLCECSTTQRLTCYHLRTLPDPCSTSPSFIVTYARLLSCSLRNVFCAPIGHSIVLHHPVDHIPSPFDICPHVEALLLLIHLLSHLCMGIGAPRQCVTKCDCSGAGGGGLGLCSIWPARSWNSR